jgi:hypothetical protein
VCTIGCLDCLPGDGSRAIGVVASVRTSLLELAVAAGGCAFDSLVEPWLDASVDGRATVAAAGELVGEELEDEGLGEEA